MPFGLGVPELLIILVILVLIFGANRLSEIGGALGKTVREFRTELKDEDKPQAAKSTEAAKSTDKPADAAPADKKPEDAAPPAAKA